MGKRKAKRPAKFEKLDGIPFEALMGILRVPGQKRVSLRAMDRAIGEAVAERFRRATKPAAK